MYCFPGRSDGKESACKVGDPGSIPGLGRSLDSEGKGNQLQYSYPENSMDRGVWCVAVCGVAKIWTLIHLYFLFPCFEKFGLLVC